MPEYKRMVSYVYAYEEGERRRNTGFVRAEAREGEWRITIQLRGRPGGQGGFKAYVYTLHEGRLQGVLLGELHPIEGGLGWKGRILPEEMRQITFRLEDTDGIFIEGPGEKRYASQWRGEPVDVDSFYIKTESAEEPENAENPKSTAKEEAAKEPENIEKTENTENPENPEEMENAKNPEEMEAAEKTEVQEERGKQEQQGTEKEEAIDESREVEAQSVEALSQEDWNDGEKMDKCQEKWEYLTSRFPVQQLLQSDGVPMACIRIGPRDLQRLPKGTWVLGNNSFLLHGYYQFRHLLLCRQEQEGKPMFFLGVPGIYNEKEQMMAELFGFGEFRRSRSMGNRNGIFGYWFRRVEEV